MLVEFHCDIAATSRGPSFDMGANRNTEGRRGSIETIAFAPSLGKAMQRQEALQ